MVVASDTAAFALRYGAELQTEFGSDWQSLIVAGEYSGHLSNDGEELQLTSPDGGVVQDFTYSNAWYPATDGGGFSLTARDPSQSPALFGTSAGWNISGSISGSPGTAETNPIPLPGSIVINEVLANPILAGGDMIELHNTTGQAIDIGGWWVSDSSADRTMYHIAPDTLIAADGYFVLGDAANYGAGSGDPGVHTAFRLSPYGFTVAVSSNSGGAAGGYQVNQSFGATPAGISAGLLTDSTGGSDFVLLASPTFGASPSYLGAANVAAAYVSPIVIDEVMYDPAQPTAAEAAAGFTDSDDFEFIELYNRTDTTQSLENYYFGSGVGFSFGWYADGAPGENRTLESGATSTWTTDDLTAGSYTVYADFSLTDQNGDPVAADSAAQYTITFPGGSQIVTVDQNTAVNGQLALGTINTTGPGTVQVQLTRGATAKTSEWTLANQVEFVQGAQDVVVGSPALTSLATQSGLTTLAPGGYVVLVSDYAAFDSRYHVAANHIPVAGAFSGHLDDQGELLALDQAGPADPVTGFVPYYRTDLVNYSSTCALADGRGRRGAALIRLRPADYGNDVNNWLASNTGGTPGAANLGIDPLPPSVPTNLSAAAAVSPTRINLTWTASTDTRSDVDHYVIYRNGVSIGTTSLTSFSDASIQAATNYTYAVSAVNRDGYESDPSAPLVAALPGIVSYDWIDSKDIELYFSEPLSAGPATQVSNYALTGGVSIVGAALSRDNTRLTLTTNQAVAASTAYTLTLNNLTTVSGNQMPVSQQIGFTYQSPTGTILLQYWANLDGGVNVSDLTNPALNPNYPNNPTSTTALTSFEAPANTGQIDYGERIVGYIYPPTTGSYVFWIASDDDGQLWLSTDANPNNAVMIASVSSATGYRQWAASPSQQSAAITLVAGQRYYIYGLQKQGSGADNLSVAWQLPGTTFNTSTGTPIPGIYLAPYGNNLDLTPPAAPADLHAAVTGANNQIALAWTPVTDLAGGIDHYVIYRDGQAYATSATASFTDVSGINSQSRHTYQVAAVNYDGVQGAEFNRFERRAGRHRLDHHNQLDQRGGGVHRAGRSGLRASRRPLSNHRRDDLRRRLAIRRNHRVADHVGLGDRQPHADGQRRRDPRGDCTAAVVGHIRLCGAELGGDVLRGERQLQRNAWEPRPSPIADRHSGRSGLGPHCVAADDRLCRRCHHAGRKLRARQSVAGASRLRQLGELHDDRDRVDLYSGGGHLHLRRQ